MSSGQTCIPMLDEAPIVREVAALPRLVGRAAYVMAQAGKIPALKNRGRWGLKRAELDRWIGARPRGGKGNDDGC